MSQLSKNISTDLLGQIFLELFQFKTRDTLYIKKALTQFSRTGFYFESLQAGVAQLPPTPLVTSVYVLSSSLNLLS